MAKLDEYRLLIRDDTAYVSHDQSETSVNFKLIATRMSARRCSLL
jgi:DNA replication protein DnaC